MRPLFISYRRQDAEGEAGRLFDDLVVRYGSENVFMDVATLKKGRDFRKELDQRVAECGALLSIIGRDWLSATDNAGQRRLDDAMDFVRLETVSALQRDIPVIPVLVRGAAMPRPEQLPEAMRELAFRNGMELTHARWGSDVAVLISALDEIFPPEPKSSWRRRTPVLWGVGVLLFLALSFGVFKIGGCLNSVGEASRSAEKATVMDVAPAAFGEKARAQAKLDAVRREQEEEKARAAPASGGSGQAPVQAVATPEPTGANDGGSTAIPTVFQIGKLDFSGEVDLDSGQGSDRSAADLSGADVVLQYDSEGKWFLNGVNRALISSLQQTPKEWNTKKGNLAEVYSRCLQTSVSGRAVNFTSADTDKFLCLRTSEGRTAVLFLHDIQLGTNPRMVQTIRTSYLTWNKVN